MRLLIGCLFTVVTGSTAVAQAPTVPYGTANPGDTIRVFANCTAGKSGHCARVTGVLTALPGDSLVLWSSEKELRMSRRAIQRVEVRSGTRGNAGAGAGFGAAAGLIFGLVVAATRDCSGEFLQDLCDASRVVEPVAAAGLGAAIGALVGLAVREDRWVDVTHTPVAVRAGPSRAGVQLAVSIAY